MTGRALVLGAGGITGVAWELGILKGLLDAGVDLTAADLVVGTSAGSIVGSQVRDGAALDELVVSQQSPALLPNEQSVELDVEQMATAYMALAQDAPSPKELRARIGALALAASTAGEAEPVAIIESRLPRHDWPSRRLLVTAVDTATGDLVAWERDADVPLVRAVAASCAIPGVWPPVTVDGRRYMDGGVRSVTNADLAAGHDAVVIVAPIVGGALGSSLDEEIATLGPAANVVLVSPDPPALEAIGPNPLDATRRVPAVTAGLRQAASVLAPVRDAWGPGA
jgi:NTE family protein